MVDAGMAFGELKRIATATWDLYGARTAVSAARAAVARNRGRARSPACGAMKILALDTSFSACSVAVALATDARAEVYRPRRA